MTDPVIQKAIGLRNGLEDTAKEWDIIGTSRQSSEARRKLAKIDAQRCRDSAEMLQKLGTEVSRLREAIGIYYYGRMSRQELWKIARTWNDDVVKEKS